MRLAIPPALSARQTPPLVLSGIIGLVFLSFAVPFFGVAVSLCLAFVTHACRDHLWPKASSTSSLTWSLIAWLGLWLPGPLLLSVFGFEPSIVWLVIPLCSPDGLNAVLLPARAVAVTCFAGLLGTVITPRVGLLRNDKGMAAGRVTDTPNGPGALPMHQPPRP